MKKLSIGFLPVTCQVQALETIVKNQETILKLLKK
jgi:hypothetical protein